MTFTIITSTPHSLVNGKYYAYGPYIREINIWAKLADKIIVIAPLNTSANLREIDLPYNKSIEFVEVERFNILSAKSILRAILVMPNILIKLFGVMKKSDHIHLRCPCNMSLLGSFVQILFPKKIKTAKYAGNWDPESNQPWSYRWQQLILGNTFLTKNIKVLVYGEWPDTSKNIIPFISATYHESEKTPYKIRDYNERLKFVFIGSLVIGKRPLLTIQIIESLLKENQNVELHMYGDGALIEELKMYVDDNSLKDCVFIHGNQTKEVVKAALIDAHFGILPSKSEGWPKAVAEAMFFGAIPISTDISCLKWMLDNGSRGIIIPASSAEATKIILKHLKEIDLTGMSKEAQLWSHNYTLEVLEKAIINTID